MEIEKSPVFPCAKKSRQNELFTIRFFFDFLFVYFNYENCNFFLPNIQKHQDQRLETTTAQESFHAEIQKSRTNHVRVKVLRWKKSFNFRPAQVPRGCSAACVHAHDCAVLPLQASVHNRLVQFVHQLRAEHSQAGVSGHTLPDSALPGPRQMDVESEFDVERTA